MKIVRLDLLAFGPFANVRLDFGDKLGLHIVHGPNEAGKSSSLRALRNLLYGIPARSPDNFIHPYAHMRIGAVIEAADGTRLEFIRRKGNKKTLRAPDDKEEFDDSKLQRLLQGIDESEFCQRFGIDYEELRAGGESLVCGDSNLAEIFFAAGSGVADLRAIQQQIKEEADSLFKPSASKPTINALISQYNEAQKAIREAQCAPSEWSRREEQLREAERQLAQLNETLKSKRVEHNRYQRICESLPLIQDRAALLEQLEQLLDAPLLAENFPTERAKAQTNRTNALRAKDKASREIARLEEQLSQVETPAVLLDKRAAIEALHDPLGSHKKAVADRSRLVGERDALRQRACMMLQKLGRPPQLDEAKKLELPTGQKKRIRDLAGKYKGLFDLHQRCQKTLQELVDEIRQVEEALERLPEPRDIAELQHVIRQVQRQSNLDEKQAQLTVTLNDRRNQVAVRLARLPLFNGTLDELERLPVPSAETIERFDREFAQADQAVARHQDKWHELQEACRGIQTKLDALRLEGDVPTHADLEQARHRRDQGWQLVQRALKGTNSQDGDQVAEFISEIAPGGDLAGAFAASMTKADIIADRLRREAERVAQQAELSSQLQQLEEKLRQTETALDEARQHQTMLESQWQTQWKPAGIEPLTPNEMASWRNQQQDLVKQAAEICHEQSELYRVIAEISSHKSRLNECLAAFDQPPVPNAESLTEALDRAEAVADKIDSSNRQRENLANTRDRLLQQRPKAERDASAALSELEQWRAAWEEAVVALGLGGDSQPAEAGDVLDQADEILQLLRQADGLEERIRGIDEDAARFKETVKHLLEQVAPDLIDTWQHSVEMAVASLFGRKDQAVKDQAKVHEWQSQLEKYQAELRDAEQNIQQWQDKLDTLCRQAGCVTDDELSRAEERSKQRHDAERELKDVEQQLRRLAGTTPLDSWIAEVASYNADEVKAALKDLEAAIHQLENDTQNAAMRVGQHNELLTAVDGGAKAAEAQMQAELLLANIRSEADEYIRLRLASEVLARAMERFREANQDPVLKRASQLFNQLTLGSFDALIPEYDDDGKGILVGVRRNGSRVAIAGMSDGTCDQLYLALRIALLESWLDEHDPLPFIVDDILVMFDDNRAAAALQVLSQLAERTQVIFFTHHQHLVDVARQSVPGDRLSIHELLPAVATAQREAVQA
jgi:uncharacterized protein YhaN